MLFGSTLLMMIAIRHMVVACASAYAYPPSCTSRKLDSVVRVLDIT